MYIFNFANSEISYVFKMESERQSSYHPSGTMTEVPKRCSQSKLERDPMSRSIQTPLFYSLRETIFFRLVDLPNNLYT